MMKTSGRMAKKTDLANSPAQKLGSEIHVAAKRSDKVSPKESNEW